jgi:polyisoprenoid-binding protein YceI
MPLPRGLVALALLWTVAAFAALLPAAAVAQAATAWSVEQARSRLEFSGTLAGGRFDGRFVRFTPTIVFDPGGLPGSRFEVEIDLASVSTGDEEWDGYLVGEDFFNDKSRHGRFLVGLSGG